MSTILLADDSLTIQKVVELTFGETEHDVIAVSEGAELLRRLPELRPDLVICDVIMPGMDGYEVCQQIKSDPATLHIPVVLLTGTFEPFDRDRAIAAGCSEIITKPFEARKLVDTVERLLESDTEAPAPASAEPDPGTVTPPPPLEPEPAVAEFGTHLSEPAADDGLEFTSTGFSDMEAAASAADEWADQPPTEGLEFEIGDDTADRLADAETGTAEAEDQPFPEPPALEPDDVEEFARTDTADAPFADAEEYETPQEPPAFVAAEPPEDDAGEGVTWSPDTQDDFPDTDNADSPDEDPFDAMPLEPLEPTSREFEHDGGDVPDDIAPSEVTPPVPDEAGADDDSASTWRTVDAEAVEPEHADTTPMESEPSAEADPADTDESHDEFSASPATEPDMEAPAQETAPAAAAIPTSTPGNLSDEDVERIARRVAELAAERIEQIAWEVIPDMAEIVVRERVRELEAEVDGATTDQVQ